MVTLTNCDGNDDRVNMEQSASGRLNARVLQCCRKYKYKQKYKYKLQEIQIRVKQNSNAKKNRNKHKVTKVFVKHI